MSSIYSCVIKNSTVAKCIRNTLNIINGNVDDVLLSLNEQGNKSKSSS